MSRSAAPAQAEAEKRAAGYAAVSEVGSGMLLGLGTGSTVRYFLEGLAEAIESGRLRDICGVPTSSWTETRCRELRIPMASLTEGTALDLVVDGADEVDASNALIKGGGGALTREKIIAASADEFICIVDDGKVVDRLGAFPLPVEVIPMARGLVARKLAGMGGRPEYRHGVVTDNGNVILDVWDLSIDDPDALERAINDIVGVVVNGIFAANRPDVVLVASEDGVHQKS